MPVDVDVLLERVDLPAERVAAHRHVDAAEGLLIGEPPSSTRSASRIMPGAGAVDRQPVLDPLAQRLEQVEGAGELDRSSSTRRPGSTSPSTAVELGRPRRTRRRAVARRRARRSSAQRARGRRPAGRGRRRWRASAAGDGLPAALGEAVRLRDVVDVDADHRLAETAGDLGDHVGVVVERRRLDDRLGPLRPGCRT